MMHAPWARSGTGEPWRMECSCQAPIWANMNRDDKTAPLTIPIHSWTFDISPTIRIPTTATQCPCMLNPVSSVQPNHPLALSLPIGYCEAYRMRSTTRTKQFSTHLARASRNAVRRVTTMGAMAVSSPYFCIATAHTQSPVAQNNS